MLLTEVACQCFFVFFFSGSLQGQMKEAHSVLSLYPHAPVGLVFQLIGAW